MHDFDTLLLAQHCDHFHKSQQKVNFTFVLHKLQKKEAKKESFCGEC